MSPASPQPTTAPGESATGPDMPAEGLSGPGTPANTLAGPPGTPPNPPGRGKQRLILWLACSAVFFEAFDVSIVNLALPVISEDLHISIATAQWVQTLYLLSFGGCLLLG